LFGLKLGGHLVFCNIINRGQWLVYAPKWSPNHLQTNLYQLTVNTFQRKIQKLKISITYTYTIYMCLMCHFKKKKLKKPKLQAPKP
jgi:hypothetical protein